MTTSKSADLALLSLGGSIPGRQAIPFGTTDHMDILDPFFALGYPALADVDDIRGGAVIGSGIEHITATDGKISRLNVIVDDVEHIQHTASFNHGNSGGLHIAAASGR